MSNNQQSKMPNRLKAALQSKDEQIVGHRNILVNQETSFLALIYS